MRGGVAGGKRLHHRAREHSDPLALLERAEAGPPARASSHIPPDEETRVIRELKAQHYAGWADEPLEALAGKTPHEAARKARGREEVGLLLKETEHSEGRVLPAQRFDFSALRRELGVEE